jgi:serine/threonine-protein kinase
MMQFESQVTESDSYGLGKRLRSGSTGDVFETRHPRLAGPSAIKILRPELVSRPGDLEMFRGDLDAVAALRHPNIVHVVEVGVSNGVAFIVTELLEGRSLAERLAGGQVLPVTEAVEIVRGVAAGLQAAHQRGVMHGEVNPHNIFLARTEGYDQGVVKVVNFGIAKLRPADAPASLSLEAIRYLSPEQAAGHFQDVDGRADQFALAAVAYRMLSGVDVFGEDSSVSVLCQLVHERPRLLPLDNSDLESILRRALSRDKRDRFESILTFARAFETAALGDRSALGRTPGPRLHAVAPETVPPRSSGGGATLHGFAGAAVAAIGLPARAVFSRPVDPTPPPPADPAPPRPAAPVARHRAAPVAPRPQPRAEATDSFLDNPFFVDSQVIHRRERMRDLALDRALRADAPRGQGWKLVLFTIAFVIACAWASMAAGWRPPLTWRQSQLWHDLRLPHAAAPLVPASP